MSNNKQSSSVEWFLDKLIEHQIIKIGQTTYGGKVNYKHEILFEQAKAMHKEEIKESLQEFLDITLSDEICEEYYNQTYGGEQ